MSHALPPLPRCILNRELQAPYANDPPPLRSTMRYANDPEYATQMTDPEIHTARSNSPLERAADQIKLTSDFNVMNLSCRIVP